MLMMKRNKWLIIILLVLLIIGVIFAVTKINGKDRKSSITDTNEFEGNPASDQSLEEIYGDSNVEVSGPLQIEIISPEGDTFIPRQARMWNAQIKNFADKVTRISSCEWKFYLNENNEEVLYKEQEARAVLTRGKDNSCGFTSTFIESRGELRAEVTLNVKDMDGNILESVKAERKYRVQ